MAKKRITLYTSEDCAPCKEVGELIKAGKFSSPDTDEVDIVDIGTDEGFARFAKEVLAKDDGAVPSAYIDGMKCRIEVLEDNSVQFNCPSNDHPVDPDEKSSPPESDA